MLGGLQWGSAVDGARVYTQINNNSVGPPWTLKGGPYACTDVPQLHRVSSAALDAATGQILWQTRPVENGVTVPRRRDGPGQLGERRRLRLLLRSGHAQPPTSRSPATACGAMYALDAKPGHGALAFRER